MTNAIQFKEEDGSLTTWYALEETVLGGMKYLLVADAPEGEAQARILKDVSAASEAEACYVDVEEDDEMAAVSKIFAELLGDVDFE